jgi:hypothetical protein
MKIRPVGVKLFPADIWWTDTTKLTVAFLTVLRKPLGKIIKTLSIHKLFGHMIEA